VRRHILQSQTFDSFRRHLRTYYFQSAYSAHPNVPWFSSETLALYKSLTYLLTYLLTYMHTNSRKEYTTTHVYTDTTCSNCRQAIQVNKNWVSVCVVAKTQTLQRTLSTDSLSALCCLKLISKLSTVDRKPSSALTKSLTETRNTFSGTRYLSHCPTITVKFNPR